MSDTMKDKKFTVSEIRELMAAMCQNRMNRLKIKDGEYSVTLEGCERAVSADGPTAIYQATVHAPAEEMSAVRGNVVTSPIVGTFYEAPSPESEPFVRVGDRVKKGDVLFIIESMKLMNEVQSKLDGVVAAIHVENAQGVEYGQSIMTIE